MNIRRAIGDERDILLDIWLRSVRATHTFLTEADIQSFLPLVREYLASEDAEFWVLEDEANQPVGFMGLDGNKLDALFLDPAYHRRGGGREMVRFAQSLKGELMTEVNEQNPGACRFYEACGFVVERRSDTDSAGRPFPLLRMRLAGNSAASSS
jgi:putative acetyltransferase